MPSSTAPSDASTTPGLLLSEVIYRHLRDAIIWGRVSPGTVLSVRKVADQWHVSPMPVREALRQLLADELVEVSPRSATRVKTISLIHVREVCEMRNVLEPAAARMAARHLTTSDCAHLRVWLCRMERAAEMERPTEWHQWDERFHTLMFRKCGNSLLERMTRDMWERNVRHFAAGAVVAPGFRARRGVEHQRILQAIETRNERAIETAWRSHTTQSGIETLAYLQDVRPAAERVVGRRESGGSDDGERKVRPRGAKGWQRRRVRWVPIPAG